MSAGERLALRFERSESGELHRALAPGGHEPEHCAGDAPEQRGHGIGQALLTHLAALAAERGCGRFEWSVLDWNAPAIAFYRALGAEPMEEWTIMRVTGDALGRLAGTA